MRTVVCISVCFLALVTRITAQSSTGTCTDDEQIAYVAQQLPASCVINLGSVNSNSILESSALDGALDVVCTDDCGGALSEWLLN